MSRELAYIIDHVFLPPKLPQTQDTFLIQDLALTEFCREGLRKFNAAELGGSSPSWKRMIQMVDTLTGGNKGDLSTGKVIGKLATMKHKDVYVLHIEAQNSGLIIRRLSTEYLFESFELSPRNKDVTNTVGRLRRYFPGQAAVIHEKRIQEDHFRMALSQLLTNLTLETPMKVSMMSRGNPDTNLDPDDANPDSDYGDRIRTGTGTMNDQDTTTPILITSMFTEILHALGRRYDVDKIQKRTREDVIHDGNTGSKPWRRSPRWLLLRVALQTGLMKRVEGDWSHVKYKSFMLFFMCHISSSALRQATPRETLCIMAMKIQRRMLKLGSDIGNDLRTYVQEVVLKMEDRLKQGIPTPLDISFPNLDESALIRDTELSIQTLQAHMTSVAERRHVGPIENSVDLNSHPRIPSNIPELPSVERLNLTDPEALKISLADLEAWVADTLPNWLEANIRSQNATKHLATVLTGYIAASRPVYADSAEDQSIRILTLMDLWVALDQCATHQIPLLLEYGPSIDPDVFASLLLPTQSQMKRLASIEGHLEARSNAANARMPSIFDVNGPSSFGVRFFDNSPRHRALLEQVETDADKAREQKLIELSERRRLFRSLKLEWESKSHDSTGEFHNYGTCAKCRTQNRMQAIKIVPCTWPLPDSELKEKSVIFELDAPKCFSVWRDCTYTLLVDVLSPELSVRSGTRCYSFSEAGLKEYAKSGTSRLEFRCKAKPVVTQQKVGELLDDDAVIRPCRSEYFLADCRASKPIEVQPDALDKTDIRKLCTLKFTSSDYETLQYALDGTSHTSNEVLAKQVYCPKALTLHEYYNFAMLRSGCRLQWLNILREMEARVLDLSSEECFLLIAQATWQAGPNSCASIYRDSHIHLEDEAFGRHLLTSLEEVLRSVESNWHGAGTVRIITMLTTRLLSMTPCSTISRLCFRLLQKARSVSLAWARNVINTLHNCQGEAELESLTIHVLELALTCHGTFDVDVSDLEKMLSSNEAQAIFTECSATIYDRCPSSILKLSAVMQMLLRRYRRIAHRAEPILRDAIINDATGIDKTVQHLWSGYRSGNNWTSVVKPKERWLKTRVPGDEVQESVFVYFNILSGQLLINGNPLTRLPYAYEKHDTYRRLFGEKVLDVIPSTMRGMRFETRQMICNQQVHFAMLDGELIIRTRYESDVFEVIPERVLQNNFPTAFVEDCIHMLNLESKAIQFRPRDSPWAPLDSGWNINIGGPPIQLCNNVSKMLDFYSLTFTTIAGLLSPLEEKRHIHMMRNDESKQLEVHLPRFKLDFFYLPGTTKLESKQYCGMFLDTCQNPGTFRGLANKLVLRGSDASSRIVIVPHGKIDYEMHGNRVKVRIDPGDGRLCSYHDFRIDSLLGRLVDNGSLRSRLFRLYLHALTSDCLPDELTGMTGTELALQGLSSASLLSFYNLSSEEIELCSKLKNLSPKRAYFPAETHTMQTITWSRLPSLSQHEDFSSKVGTIFSYAKQLKQLHDSSDNQQTGLASENSPHALVTRAGLRNLAYRVDRSEGLSFTTEYDVEYSSRDGDCDKVRREAVYTIAGLVEAGPRNLDVSKDFMKILRGWQREPIQDSEANLEGLLDYDARWFDSPQENLVISWCALYRILSNSDRARDKYKIMILLSTIASAQSVDEKILHTLLAFSTNAKFRGKQIPRFVNVSLKSGYKPDESTLKLIFTDKSRTLQDSPANSLVRQGPESIEDLKARRMKVYKNSRALAIIEATAWVKKQWPVRKPSPPTSVDTCTYLDLNAAMQSVQTKFEEWYRNKEFRDFLEGLQDQLRGIGGCSWTAPARQSYTEPKSDYTPKTAHIRLKDLLKNNAPSFQDQIPMLNIPQISRTKRRSIRGGTSSRLGQLLRELTSNMTEGFHADYLGHLRESLDAFYPSHDVDIKLNALKTLLDTHVTKCRDIVDSTRKAIEECLLSSLKSPGTDYTVSTMLLPRLSPIQILSMLAESHPTKLSQEWKSAIVYYGVAIAALQHAERLVACGDNQSSLVAELSNPGHETWDPVLHPDWLLLELENNLLIRQDQARVAEEMIKPASGANSVMQLNMGLGKSSVIVPIVACTLADKENLCRVVVLRALSRQMMQVLISKLGGMINRRVFFLPISRALEIDTHKANVIRKIYESCLISGGILLVQPEHLLSFELMGFNMALNGNETTGKVMHETQCWLHEKSRDILDESDEILNVRFEVIYTVGMQRDLEFSPDRWAIFQRVLSVIHMRVGEFQERYPDAIEMETLQYGSGAFPRFRILRGDVGDLLIEDVARHICERGLGGLSFFRFTIAERDLLYQYITNPTVDPDELALFRHLISSASPLKKGLLLLRGLFAHGVLKFAFFQKRWRVSFGLDLERSSLAVPYHGKDVPSPRAEFSHPDTTILLTCLSYYYGGLSAEHAMACFKKLLLTDNSESDYEKWTNDCHLLDPSFKQLNGVNLSDYAQWHEHVYTPLRRSKGMIDFYLCHLVFPKEIKEFPHKLSSSGWDIARRKAHPLTGFSGTNDSRYILPLSTKQTDLTEQRSTNAEVLVCLLQSENTFDSTESSEQFDADFLIDLALASKPPVRVILDVGAQVLELRNEEVASRWLSLLPPSEALAAIYCDSSDEICVLTRDGTTEPLLISPFAKQMDQCVVYLDESHTRGTDLKLPSDYRALVTLGPGLSKDRLAQACMRMRKLGKGQSVLFTAPQDIQRQIRERGGKDLETGRIEVRDVLMWCIYNTMSQIRTSIIPWAIQGKRHYQRLAIMEENPGVIPESILEPEAQSLKERYQPGKMEAEIKWLADRNADADSAYVDELSAIRKTCKAFEVASFAGSSLHEEQERELEPETQREIEVERAPRVEPLKHEVHPSVRKFIKEGILPQKTSAFGSAWKVLRKTSAKKESSVLEAWPEGLLVTKDFAQTVKLDTDKDLMDLFLKPVHWVVTYQGEYETLCVIMSAYEIQELLPSIREHQKVTLHLYSPRTSVYMRPFDKLDMHTIPTLQAPLSIPLELTQQLNLFAGQLYLDKYEDYIDLCRFLGICYKPSEDVQIAYDNFVGEEARGDFDLEMLEKCRFARSPVGLLKMVIAMRRKGMGFEGSHLGRLLNGELLGEGDFVVGVGDRVREVGGDDDDDEQGDGDVEMEMGVDEDGDVDMDMQEKEEPEPKPEFDLTGNMELLF